MLQTESCRIDVIEEYIKNEDTHLVGILFNVQEYKDVKVKVKQSHYSPGLALRVLDFMTVGT